MGYNNIKFISNNVRGTKISGKWIKILEYLKNKFDSNGVLFLQEMHFLWVAIGYWSSKSAILEERKTDKNSRILLIDVKTDEQNFVLVNLFNANTEKDQLNTINELSERLKSVNNISAKQIILGGDFNLSFDSLLEIQGGNPMLKKSLFLKWLSLKTRLNFAICGGLEIPKSKDLLL